MPEQMGRAAAIREFFGSEGYEKVSLKEIKEFKVGDPEGYEEIGNLCVKHFGCEVKELV
jgi:hypothetical protein